MPYQEIFEKLRSKFVTFGNEMGFMEWYTVYDDYFIEVYLCKEHALRLYAELPDTYLDVYAVPLKGSKQANGYEKVSRAELARQVSIFNIYSTTYPRCTEAQDSFEAALQYVLDRLIEIVRCHPAVLVDFMANIEDNTSPSCIQEYTQTNLLQSLQFARQDFMEGRMDPQVFESTVNIILKELRKYE